jgi:prepilin-type N-terminal cleavage/methylation domain-containing protein
MKNEKGFSLIELMIVVAVIGILAVIAVPNLLKSKAAADEASAIASVRNLMTAEVAYFATTGNRKFGSLDKLMSAKVVDDVLGSGSKDGYTFAVPTGDGASDNFTITAVPITVGKTGFRGFFGDATGVIRYTADGSTPSASSPGLGK